MTRLIDADALKKAFEVTPYNDVDDLARTERLIDNAPTVEPQKVCVANVTFDDAKLREIVDEAIKALEDEPLFLAHSDGTIEPIKEKIPCSYPMSMVYRGFDSHSCSSHYLCPVCKKDYDTWGLYRERLNPHDTFTCDCGQLLEVPE